ncbi:hypothetical protein ACHQM5_016376 [Ranunculus cassubicifolius]
MVLVVKMVALVILGDGFVDDSLNIAEPSWWWEASTASVEDRLLRFGCRNPIAGFVCVYGWLIYTQVESAPLESMTGCIRREEDADGGFNNGGGARVGDALRVDSSGCSQSMVAAGRKPQLGRNLTGCS